MAGYFGRGPAVSRRGCGEGVRGVGGGVDPGEEPMSNVAVKRALFDKAVVT